MGRTYLLIAYPERLPSDAPAIVVAVEQTWEEKMAEDMVSKVDFRYGDVLLERVRW